MNRKIGSDAKVLAYIERHRRERGYPPSVRDVADEFEISRGGAHEALRRLERDGLLVRPAKIPRAMSTTRAGMKLIKTEEMK